MEIHFFSLFAPLGAARRARRPISGRAAAPPPARRRGGVFLIKKLKRPHDEKDWWGGGRPPGPGGGGPIPGPGPDIFCKNPLFFGLAGASRPRRMAAGANPTDWSCTATSHIIPSTQLLAASGAAGGVGTPEVAQKSGTPSPIWPPWGREIAAANSRGARPRGRPRAAGGGPPGRPGSPPCSTIVLFFTPPKSAQKVTFGEFPLSCRMGFPPCSALRGRHSFGPDTLMVVCPGVFQLFHLPHRPVPEVAGTIPPGSARGHRKVAFPCGLES